MTPTGDGAPLRVVVDTNVIVSALIRPRGAPGAVLRASRDRRVVAVVSAPMLEEIAAVLARSWLQERYGIRDDDIRDLFRLLAVRTEFVTPQTEIRRCRDPHDDRFLEAAAEGHADRIVTGDADLLELGQCGSAIILTPAALVAELD